MNNSIALRPAYFASVSGGKDSLYMLNLILSNLEKYPLDGVFHSELEIDFPFVKDIIDEMEKRCKIARIPFYRIRPRISWEDLYLKYGYPSSVVRWCNSKYKLDALNQLNCIMKESGKYVISYIGFCADEQKRFKNELYGRNQYIKQIYPIAEAGIKEYDIWLWARKQSIFNDYYLYNYRLGCMACPMSNLSSLAYLYAYYPEEYKYYMTKAKQTEFDLRFKTGKKISIWCGNEKYNTDYILKTISEKYIPLKELPVQYEQITFFD